MKKIVIQVHMESDKSRSKALKIAAATQGLHSISLEGESRDQVVVTGDRIDSVYLTNKLRKKFSYATLISVTDVDASSDQQEGGDSIEEPTYETISRGNVPVVYHYASFPPPSYPIYHVEYDPYPNYCAIL